MLQDLAFPSFHRGLHFEPNIVEVARLPSHNRMKNFRIIIETCQDIMRGHHRLFASLLISKKFLLLRHLYLGCQLNIHSIDICKKNPQNQINIPTHQKQNSANSRVARGHQTWDTLSRSKIRMWWTMCVSEKKVIKNNSAKNLTSLKKGSQKKSWASSFSTAVGKPTRLKSFPIPSQHHIEIFREDEV